MLLNSYAISNHATSKSIRFFGRVAIGTSVGALHSDVRSVLYAQFGMSLPGLQSRSRLSSNQLESTIFGILFQRLEVSPALGSIPGTQFNLSER